MTQEAARHQYEVSSKWCGWWGGWGSYADMISHIEERTTEGWQLVETKNMLRFWWWLIPRPKVLFIYSRAI